MALAFVLETHCLHINTNPVQWLSVLYCVSVKSWECLLGRYWDHGRLLKSSAWETYPATTCSFSFLCKRQLGEGPFGHAFGTCSHSIPVMTDLLSSVLHTPSSAVCSAHPHPCSSQKTGGSESWIHSDQYIALDRLRVITTRPGSCPEGVYILVEESGYTSEHALRILAKQHLDKCKLMWCELHAGYSPWEGESSSMCVMQ